MEAKRAAVKQNDLMSMCGAFYSLFSLLHQFQIVNEKVSKLFTDFSFR